VKRLLLILIALGLVGTAGYLLINQVGTPAVPADLLAVDTPLIIELTDPITTLSRFRTSRLAKKLGEVDRGLLCRELGIEQSRCRGIERRIRAVAAQVDNPVMKELFGRQVVLALTVPDAGGTERYAGAALDQLVAVVRPRHRAALLDFFGRLLAGKAQQLVEKYEGIAIRRVFLDRDRPMPPGPGKTESSAESLTLFTATADGLLMAAFSPQPLRRCIDRLRHRLPAAASRASDEMPDGLGGDHRLFGYCKLDRLCRLLRQDRLYLPPPLRQRILNLAAAAAVNGGISTMVITASSQGRRLSYTAALHYDSSDHAAPKKTLFRRLPDANRSLALVPGNQLLYFWTNYFDLNIWLSKWRGFRYDPVEWLEETLLKTTGLGIAELSALFGRNFALSVANVNADHYVPLPMMCFFLQIKDRARMEEILRKSLDGLPVKYDMVNSTPVTSIQAAGGLLQPSYAWVDDLLIVADSREQIEAVLAADGSEKLVNDPFYRRIDNGMGEKNNAVTFIRTEQLLGVLQTFAGWAGTTLTIEDEGEAERLSLLVNRVIMPILEGLKMYRITNGRFYNTGNEFKLEADVLTGDA